MLHSPSFTGGNGGAGPLQPSGGCGGTGGSGSGGHDDPATTAAGVAAVSPPRTDESLELMFNPILNCYYDPRSGKFYQLKDDDTLGPMEEKA
jgi:hypothetical protein